MPPYFTEIMVKNWIKSNNISDIVIPVAIEVFKTCVKKKGAIT